MVGVLLACDNVAQKEYIEQLWAIVLRMLECCCYKEVCNTSTQRLVVVLLVELGEKLTVRNLRLVRHLCVMLCYNKNMK